MRVTHRQLRRLVRDSIRRTLISGNRSTLNEAFLGSVVTDADEYDKMSTDERETDEGKALRAKLEDAVKEFEGFEITNKKAKRAVAGSIKQMLSGQDIDMNQLQAAIEDVADEVEGGDTDDTSGDPKDWRWSKYGWTYVFTPDGAIYTIKGDDNQAPISKMIHISKTMKTKANEKRKIPPGSTMYSVIADQGYRRGQGQQGMDKSKFKKEFPKQYAEKKKLNKAWDAHAGSGGSPKGSAPGSVPEIAPLRGSLLESRKRASRLRNKNRFIMDYVKRNF